MSAAETPAPARGLTLRAVVVAVVLAWLGTEWMKFDGIIAHTVQLGESVPPIPAVAALCLFLVLNPLLARISPRLALSRAELVVVFVILSITPVLNSVGMMRMLLPSTSVASYFATPENHLERIAPLVPSWYGPQSAELIRQLYEGADNGQVPWGAWLAPMARWCLFVTVFFVTLLSLNVLLRKQWSERERLAFPLVQFIAPLTPGSAVGGAAILRNPLFWTGFAIAFVYNLLNMLHAVNPSVPAPSKSFNLGALFTERPWSAIQGELVIQYRPEILGLGYLMSTEITLSCWVFYLLVRLSKVVATMFGTADQIPGFPFDRELCMGSYLALTVFVLWVARRHLAAAARSAFGRGEPGLDAGEAMSYRWAFVGFFGGFVFMTAWAVKAGMALWLAVLYFAIVVGVALTYARMRAETGAPMVWLFPFWEQQKFLTNVFGAARLVPAGPAERWADFRSLTTLHGFAWLARGYYTSTGANQAEAFRLGEEVHVPRRQILWALLFACVLGFGLAARTHLQVYYEYGGNVLEGGSTEGGYRIKLMRDAYTEVATWSETRKTYQESPEPPKEGWGPPDKRRSWAYTIGFAFTALLLVLRTVFLRFPLHPLGFAMVMAYGSPVWGPALVVWMIKTTVLRIGGVQLYKRLIPLFIGIVLGHFFASGVVWGTVALFNEELAERYGVWFG